MRRTLTLASALLVVASAGLAACGNDKDARHLTVTASDSALAVPTDVSAGVTEFTLQVDGRQPHQLQLLKLNDGVEVEEVMAAAGSPDPSGLFALVSVAGGVSSVAPGSSASAIVNLTKGSYLAFDFTSPTTKPAVFSVEGEDSTAGTPKAKATVDLVDFGISMPSGLHGDETLKVVNQGQQPHEVAIFRLGDGVTMDDLMQAMQSGTQPAITPVGGIGAIPPGADGYIKLALTGGNYVAMCFVPDPASGTAHAAMGMMAPFTIG